MIVDMAEPVPVKGRLRDAVIEARGAPMEAKALLHVLIYHADTTTLTCWPSVPTIAREAGCNEDTARKWLGILAGANIIRRFTRTKDSGANDSPGWVIAEEHLKARLESIPRSTRGSIRPGRKDPTPSETSDGPGRNDPTAPVGNIGPPPSDLSDTNTVSEPDQGTLSVNPVSAPASGAAPIPTGGLFDGLRKTDPSPAIEPPPKIEPAPSTQPRKPRKRAEAKEAAGAASQPERARVWGYQEAIDAWDHAFAEVMETAYPWVWTGQYANGKHVKTWLAAARIKCEADVPDGIGRIYGAALAYLRAVKAGAAWPREEKPNVPRFAKDIAQWLQTDPDATPRANGKIDPNQATRDALARALQQMEGVAN